MVDAQVLAFAMTAAVLTVAPCAPRPGGGGKGSKAQGGERKIEH